MLIVNGYAKSPQSYRQNSRPKSLLITQDGKKQRIDLADNTRPQWFALAAGASHQLKIEVQDTYRGDKYSDVCISEIITDARVYSAYLALEAGSKISSLYTPDSMNSDQNSAAILHAYQLFLSNPSEDSLRMLLSDIEYSDSGATYNAEFNESLKQLVNVMIKEDPDIVLNVVSAETRSHRSIVIGSWINILGSTVYDSTQALLESPTAPPELKRFAKGIQKYLNE